MGFSRTDYNSLESFAPPLHVSEMVLRLLDQILLSKVNDPFEEIPNNQSFLMALITHTNELTGNHSAYLLHVAAR